MKNTLLLMRGLSSPERPSFYKYNPAYLLLVGVLTLVLHAVLQLCSPPSYLVLKITNIVETLSCILAFGGIVLLLSRKPTRAQWFFIIMLCVYLSWVIPCLGPALLVEKLDLIDVAANPFLRIIDGFLFMSIMLYMVEILRPNYLKFRTILKILSPLLIVPVLGIISNHLKSDGQELMGKLISISRMLFIVGYPLVILIYSLMWQKTYKQCGKQNYVNLEDLSNSWLKYYMVAYFFIGITYCHVMLHLSYESLLVHHTLHPLFFVLILPFILRQQEFAIDPEDDEDMLFNAKQYDLDEQNEKERQIYSKSKLMYKKKLVHWMEQDKPYLKIDFRLIDIHNILPLNSKYISRLIKDELDETFYSLIMKYRIEESVRLLVNKQNLTIAEIATKSGFSSPSVFGRSFLKEKGITPLEYRKKYMITNK